jgi:hypothetical protein
MNPQEWTLNRMTFTDKSTVGELWIDGAFFCFTLEPTCRDKKSEHPAIPAKRYLINTQYSNRFGRQMPHIANVPDRTDILIHWGNFPTDTEGCILVGETKGPDFIGSSRSTFDKLWTLVQERTKDKLLFITVLGGRAALDA